MMVARKPRHVVVIGAGLNALSAAAYLAKAHRHVLVLDPEEAGGPATAELAPGFTIEPVAAPGWISAEIRRELGLERQGLDLLAPDMSVTSAGDDGEPLVMWRDQRQTVEAIRRRSPRDAEHWPAFAGRMERLAGFLAWMYQRTPPRLKGSSLADWLDLAALGRRARTLGKADLIELARVMPMPVADLIEETFQDRRLKALIAAGAVAGIQHGPRSGGTAFAWLHHHVGADAGAVGMRQRIRGGSAGLAAALANAARSAGAEIRCGAPVAAVKIANGRATGVLLQSGEDLDAVCVVSGLGIRRTLLNLVGPASLDPELVRSIQNIRYRGVVARVHLALDGLPRFRGIPESGLAGPMYVTPDLEGIERAYDHAKYGRESEDPLLDVRIPSITDQTLAPAGHHVMSIAVQYAPYRLRDATWDAARRDALADRVIARLSAIAPDLSSRVLHRLVLTPADLADRYGLPEGSIEHGELALDQMLFMRPVPECARYGTPIDALYLCGDDMHPGRDVAGGAGRLAARQVLKAALANG
jgi:phytoene dehydrogenase-like protein